MFGVSFLHAGSGVMVPFNCGVFPLMGELETVTCEGFFVGSTCLCSGGWSCILSL